MMKAILDKMVVREKLASVTEMIKLTVNYVKAVELVKDLAAISMTAKQSQDFMEVMHAMAKNEPKMHCPVAYRSAAESPSRMMHSMKPEQR
jgi:hypothetical protein